jgi:hypothetical protein
MHTRQIPGSIGASLSCGSGWIAGWSLWVWPAFCPRRPPPWARPGPRALCDLSFSYLFVGPAMIPRSVRRGYLLVASDRQIRLRRSVRQRKLQLRAVSRQTGFETVIIGGGQAGLAVGYNLARREQSLVILEANERIGDSWRNRWDSLRVFTPARYDGLPGWPFPAPGWSYPTKDEVANYLESYATRFRLPVRTGIHIDGLARADGGYVIRSGPTRYEAHNVVVATGAYQTPRIPEFASDLSPDVAQLHSSQYRNPSQLREGGVLVVGAGNSGAEIALEASARHPTWLSGRGSRAGATRDRCTRRAAHARRRRNPRRGQCDLVHRVRVRLQLDRSPRLRSRWRTQARAWGRSIGARALLQRRDGRRGPH